eukprot:scaffold165124_cov20-Tisochrysis_lutea.AAC.1
MVIERQKAHWMENAGGGLSKKCILCVWLRAPGCGRTWRGRDEGCVYVRACCWPGSGLESAVKSNNNASHIKQHTKRAANQQMWCSLHAVVGCKYYHLCAQSPPEVKGQKFEQPIRYLLSNCC